MSELRMDAYYYSFEPTKIRVVDEVLSAIAQAGKSYHNTENWNEELYGNQSPVGQIQEAANQAAARIVALESQVKAADRIVEAAENVTINTITDFNKHWCSKLGDALDAYRQSKEKGK